jgi:hypothetical protein
MRTPRRLFEIGLADRLVCAETTMQSMSVHIGLDQVDPQEYGGWRGDLTACEADARAMAALAEAQGIATRVLLLTGEATYARVMAELERAAAVLRHDDYLLLTFAGHGASFDDIPIQVAPTAATPAATDEGDAGNAGDELDGRDEAWCLYDTYVLDDELHDYFCKIAPGVRVCVVSDSCFSGTVTRGSKFVERMPGRRPGVTRNREPADGRERRVAPRLADALYRRHFLTKYLPRSLAVHASRGSRPGAHIMLLAGCQDDQTAVEGDGHGRFTEQLLRTWNGGSYQGSHPQFIEQIKAAMPIRQQPGLFVCGEPSVTFLSHRPFTPGP